MEPTMKCIINARGVVSDSLEGPLAAHISPFSKWVRSQGYSSKSVGDRTRIGAFFSRWLGQHGIQLRDVSIDHAKAFLRHHARTHCHVRSYRAALAHLIGFLQQRYVIPLPKRCSERLSSADRCLQGYERYLRQDRALAKATIIYYLSFIGEFLHDRFGKGRVKLSVLRARDVVRFVQRRAPRLHLKRAKLMTTVLRSFFRYTRLRGYVRFDLAAAVPIVANWSMPSIPRAIAPEQVRQLLASIDRQTPMGRRDYAILLVLARLGLRANEVASLELEDIDWYAGKLSVRDKRGQRHDMPLPADVGKAIAAYLRRGRPQSASRRVFLRTRAPIDGFRGACGIGSIVRHRLQHERINSPTCGAHQFRHGLATQMLRHGASLAEIGALLGHRHPDTTRIYTKVDLRALRTLAQAWPGGGR
jgi:integrase/recombinase XerD